MFSCCHLIDIVVRRGGSSIFIDAMVNSLKRKPIYSRRVAKSAPTPDTGISVAQVDYTTNADPQTALYDYVVTTISFPALGFVGLDECNLSQAQRQAIRSLQYSSSVKIGLKFKSRWWEDLPGCGIKGGVSKTDRILRNVVYPSYGIDDLNADAVLIASYSWAQDAQRLGPLIKGHNSPEEKIFVELTLKDLSALHGFDSADFLREQFVDYWAWDWGASPFSGGKYAVFFSFLIFRIFLETHNNADRKPWTDGRRDRIYIGAYASFAPGQFSGVYPSCGQPAAGGRLFFAGEATNENHG